MVVRNELELDLYILLLYQPNFLATPCFHQAPKFKKEFRNIY